ncbi:hypothetical protein PR048_026447 [Dryococelus australis]|uniref:Uncharacterized protein n=1 Tax=Dryococelus australis TaxID=614101 RepID=A0ABQ9GLC5_9NEOP|nr:hypothetical protein PR048_026447 [Dryococelus australis]
MGPFTQPRHGRTSVRAVETPGSPRYIRSGVRGPDSCLADNRKHYPADQTSGFSLIVLLNIHMCLNMLKDDEIQAEIPIHLVQDKPRIWDKSLQDYKNRNMTRDASRRVSVELQEHFES